MAKREDPTISRLHALHTVTELQDLAASRPAHARYLAAVLAADPGKPWLWDAIPRPARVSWRVAEALHTDVIDLRRGRPATAYRDVRWLAQWRADGGRTTSVLPASEQRKPYASLFRWP